MSSTRDADLQVRQLDGLAVVEVTECYHPTSRAAERARGYRA